MTKEEVITYLRSLKGEGHEADERQVGYDCAMDDAIEVVERNWPSVGPEKP